MDFDDKDAIRVQLIHPIRTHGADITTVGERVEVLDYGIVLRLDAVRVFVPHTNVASIEAVDTEETSG